MPLMLPIDTTLPEWEKHQFLTADHFSVVLFLGRGQFERQTFAPADLRQAIAAARQPSTNSRQRMLYAVTAEGRQVLIKPVDYDSWLGEFEAHGKNKHKKTTIS